MVKKWQRLYEFFVSEEEGDFDCEKRSILSFIRSKLFGRKMGKAVIKMSEKDLNAHEIALTRAKKILGEKCVCCILITCSETAENGEMQVEMHFDGDESLAAFLLESANQVFDEKIFERESK